MLAGRDKRLSFSFSERKGRFEVNCNKHVKVNLKNFHFTSHHFTLLHTSSVKTLGSKDLLANEVFEALVIVLLTSRSGVDVMVLNGDVYH